MKFLILIYKIILIQLILLKFRSVNCNLINRNRTRYQINRSTNRNVPGLKNAGSSATRRQQINNLTTRCELPILNNGDVKLRHRGKLIRFVCNKDYFLVGNNYAACNNIFKWDSEIPVCVKSGCRQTLKSPDNAIISYEKQNSIANLFCKLDYIAAGGKFSYCNGTSWDRPLGECRKRPIDYRLERFCDFESDDICGWQQDDFDDFQWKRMMGFNIYKRVRTGPQHDHTTMRSFGGHYMFIESINKISMSYARLVSPIYPKKFSSNSCFNFWYHMYGATVGSLRVYVKPISVEWDSLTDSSEITTSFLFWEKSGNQGNQWRETIFILEKLNEDFQIVFEATAGDGHLSDIAIDDVALQLDEECYLLESTVSTETSDYNTLFETETTTYSNTYFQIIDILSCQNRCNETSSLIQINSPAFKQSQSGSILLCDCHEKCQEIETCCPDFISVCELMNFSKSDDQYETSTFNNDYTIQSNTYSKFPEDEELSTITEQQRPQEIQTTIEDSFTNSAFTFKISPPQARSTKYVSDYEDKGSTIRIRSNFTTVIPPVFTGTTILEDTEELKSTPNQNSFIFPIRSNDEDSAIDTNSHEELSTTKTVSSSTNDEMVTIADVQLKESTEKTIDKPSNNINQPKQEMNSLSFLIGIVLTILLVFIILIIIGSIIHAKKLKYFNPNILKINRNIKKSPPLLKTNNESNNVYFSKNDEELDFSLQTSPNDDNQNNTFVDELIGFSNETANISDSSTIINKHDSNQNLNFYNNLQSQSCTPSNESKTTTKSDMFELKDVLTKTKKSRGKSKSSKKQRSLRFLSMDYDDVDDADCNEMNQLLISK